MFPQSDLLASGAGQSVDGAPDIPVNKDPGLQQLIEAHDVIMYIPAFLSETHTRAAVTHCNKLFMTNSIHHSFKNKLWTYLHVTDTVIMSGISCDST